MVDRESGSRDLSTSVMPRQGRLEETGNEWEPYRLIAPDGQVVAAAAMYFKELRASGSPATTIRSYGMDLLRWWRFLTAIEVSWHRATRGDARDFMLWLQLADKPEPAGQSPHRQRESALLRAAIPASGRLAPGAPNPITGKLAPARKYAPSTQAHCETVLRAFYDFHRELGSGPIINPFPLARTRTSGRAHAHHNPLNPFTPERQGRYRPKIPARIPRRIPDDRFDELFRALGSDRDRALLAFWVSTGARAAELLGVRQRDADPGQQLITVVRKGSRAVQRLPASPDAFVWLRLYQEQMHRQGMPRGSDQPLWWTLRRPWRPLTYHAARKMFVRVNETLGANWTLHDLRHTAAYRMARDPELPLVDVQWMLGHTALTTTQRYLTASQDEIIQGLLAHHARQDRRPAQPPPAAGYDPRSLEVLFGGTL